MPIIELDCPPGSIRPDNLLPIVIDGTGLKVEDFEITSKSFGNWEFTLKEDKEDTNEIYKKCKDKIGTKIKELYKMGRIRYGSYD